MPVYKRTSVSITSYEYIRILTCCQRKTIIQLTNMTVLFKYLLAVEMVCICTLCLGNGLAESTPTYCIPGPPGRDGRDGRDGLPGPPGIECYHDLQQLKEEIIELRHQVDILNCCSTIQPDIALSLRPTSIPNTTLPSSTMDPSPPSTSIPSTTQPSSTMDPNPQPTSFPKPQCSGATEDEPANSCKEIYDCDPTLPSGNYWVTRSTGGAVEVFCDMQTTNCGSISGGWMRTAYIDMTIDSNSCPPGIGSITVDSTRMCTCGGACCSINFPTFGVPFTNVCGRVRGYQHVSPDGFANFFSSPISGPYVDGISITHGNPRNHIWTFGAGLSKDYEYPIENCPCSSPNPGVAPPSFVGENYFCESGHTGAVDFTQRQWYLDDPLWDSKGCTVNSTCCNRGGPWFSTALNGEVTDNIEVRVCMDQSPFDEALGVDQLEIYIH